MAGRRAPQQSEHPWMEGMGNDHRWQQQQQTQGQPSTHWPLQQQGQATPSRPQQQAAAVPQMYQNTSVGAASMLPSRSAGGAAGGAMVDPSMLASTSDYSTILAQQQQRQLQQHNQSAGLHPGQQQQQSQSHMQQPRGAPTSGAYPHYAQSSYSTQANLGGAGWPQSSGPSTPSIPVSQDGLMYPHAGQSYQPQTDPRLAGPSHDSLSRQQQQQHQGGHTSQIGAWQAAAGGGSVLPLGVEEDDDDEDAGKTKGRQKAGTSDFVKKLFTMLDDLSYASIVSWSTTGDSFVVRNMNDFTKHVLPRHFRHSNFASFVRQLNKYDFHKVKNPEEQSTGPADHIWEFKHPEFARGREDLLENVRRKLPSGKKKAADDRDSPLMYSASDAYEKVPEDYYKLKEQIVTLTATQDAMSAHIAKLTKQYQGVIGEMLTFQRNMVQQDHLMQNLIQYLMNLESDRKIEAIPSTSNLGIRQDAGGISFGDGPFVSNHDASRLVGSYEQVANAAFGHMTEVAQRHVGTQQQQQQQQHPTEGPTPAMTSTPAATRSSGVVETPLSHHRRVSTAGNLSPKSIGAHDSPSVTGGPSNVLDAFARSEKGKDQASPNNPGGGLDTGIFLHPPHLDDAESNNLFSNAASAVDNPTLAAFESAGLRVFTVGTLQPRADAGIDANGSPSSTLNNAFGADDDKSEDPNIVKDGAGLRVPPLDNLPSKMPKLDQTTDSKKNNSGSQTEGRESRTATPGEGASNTLRVRRSTIVPGWAVPPKVLLVDDDAVCRKLSSKFLQVFGCAIDVAVDGVNAVNKMNLEQYDLVLMDIVMPNLDGVSATSLIREFDAKTPIISMTSNSGPTELLNYMSSGMNDMLPKPFTKEGLLSMLEKHLIHLKTVQKMDQIPKSLGLPPVSKEALQGVLNATAASGAALGLPEGSGPGSSANGSEKGLSNAAGLGHGPGVKLEASPFANGHTASHGEDMANPLSEVGFSDEDYINMIQSLLAAGTVSGDMSDNVAGMMGVPRGSPGGADTSLQQSASASNPSQGGGLGGAAGGEASTGGRKRNAGDIAPSDQDHSSSREENGNGRSKKAKARLAEVRV